MKKKILILTFIILLLTISTSYAGWNGSIWTSVFGENSRYPANPSFLEAAKYSAGIDIGYSFNISKLIIEPYAKTETYIDKRVDHYYTHPAGIKYYSGLKVSYDNFYLLFEHMCWHGVDNYSSVYQYDMIQFGITFGE
jgi:hypothetical protein